jgi:hypothetical protein
MPAFTYGPVELPRYQGTAPFYRADLRFYGVDHSGPSYEARVFINNREASEQTPLTTESGFAGSYHIFGHGGCFGDEGHCDATRPLASVYDRRGYHQLWPATKTVTVTDTLRALCAAEDSESHFTVTVVPIVYPSAIAKAEDAETVLHFEELQLVTYD